MPHVPCGSQGFVPRNTGHDDGCVQGVGCKVKIQLIYLDRSLFNLITLELLRRSSTDMGCSFKALLKLWPMLVPRGNILEMLQGIFTGDLGRLSLGCLVNSFIN